MLQVIELPIKHPELFEALGVAQPKVFCCLLFANNSRNNLELESIISYRHHHYYYCYYCYCFQVHSVFLDHGLHQCHGMHKLTL